LRADLASEFSVRVEYDGADLSKPSQVAAIVKKTQDDLGKLDILVNNAGIQFVSPVEEFRRLSGKRLLRSISQRSFTG